MDRKGFIEEVKKRGAINISVLDPKSGYGDWRTVEFGGELGTAAEYAEEMRGRTVMIFKLDKINPPSVEKDIQFYAGSLTLNDIDTAWGLEIINKLPFVTGQPSVKSYIDCSSNPSGAEIWLKRY